MIIIQINQSLLINIEKQMQSQHRQSSRSTISPSKVQQKTLLQQTLLQIQKRVQFFSSHGLSAQNTLIPTQNLTVRSISQIITPLKYHYIGQTPLNLNLSLIYHTNDQNLKKNIQWAMNPPSQGQDSINQQEVIEPSLRWLTSSFIDPSLLEMDSIQPKKVERGKVPIEWKGVTQIAIINVRQKIYIRSQVKQIESLVKKKFEKFTWLKFKRAKQIYYKGKPSVILKFGDQNAASFAYYNLSSWKTNRDEFGQECEILRVTKDNLRQTDKLKNWIILYFRRLPSHMTKQSLLNIISVTPNLQLKWVEQLIEIAGYKYGICKVGYLDDALALCSAFNLKKIRDARVNIHPKSSKNWKAQENNQILVIEQQNIESLNVSIDKSY